VKYKRLRKRYNRLYQKFSDEGWCNSDIISVFIRIRLESPLKWWWGGFEVDLQRLLWKIRRIIKNLIKWGDKND